MKTIITAGPPPGQLRLLDRNLSQSLPSRHYWPLRLAARTFTLLTAALLLSAGAIRADLVLSMNPSDYNTETKQWPIADGSMTGYPDVLKSGRTRKMSDCAGGSA